MSTTSPRGGGGGEGGSSPRRPTLKHTGASCGPSSTSCVPKSGPYSESACDRLAARTAPTPPTRSVSFSSVSISEHSLTLGDHPDVSYGPPITLSWAVESTSSHGIDEYETQRGPGGCNPRKTVKKKTDLSIKYSERKRILLDAGHSHSEIDKATMKANRAKARREVAAAEGENSLGGVVEDALRSAMRRCRDRLLRKKTADCSDNPSVGRCGKGKFASHRDSLMVETRVATMRASELSAVERNSDDGHSAEDDTNANANAAGSNGANGHWEQGGRGKDDTDAADAADSLRTVQAKISESVNAEDEPAIQVDAADAVDALQKAKSMLRLRLLEDDQLLDLAAEALQIGAAGLKSAASRTEDRDEVVGDADRKDDLVEAVRRLSVEVLQERLELLNSLSRTFPASMCSSGPEGPEEEVEAEAPLIVYATHAGRWRHLADDIAGRLGPGVRMRNMKHLTLAEVQRHRTVYFVVSTVGMSCPPRDGEAFFESLKDAEAGSLWGVSFAVASLGNAVFENLATFGQMLAYELRQKGAKELIHVKNIDGNHGRRTQEEQFLLWKRKMVDNVGPGSTIALIA